MNAPKLLIIGEIVRSHGLEGAVKVRVVADALEQFSSLRKVQLQREAQLLGEYVIEKLQSGNDGFFVKFRGVNDRHQADFLRGAQLMMARDECLPLQPEQFYRFDLVGLPVFKTTGEPVGEIVDIQFYPANDVWVIHDGKKEKLIPAIDTVVKKVDLANRRVIIDPMPGLLDE